ncbi:MAG: zinc-binding dehydrogenase [Trueperaceae bacterium]
MEAVMKVAAGSGNVELREIAEPAPGPGEALVEVSAAGICGTDLHIYHDEFRCSPPVVLGHEVAGRVVALGPGAAGVLEGDRVTSETYFSTCSRCRYCRAGQSNLCPERRSIGSAIDGGFARHLVVPARNLHRLPDNVSDKAGALTEPLACVAHALLGKPAIRAGDVVAIAGPGAIGLLAGQVARAAGATVVMLGTAADQERLALARRLGASHTVVVDEQDPQELLAGLTVEGHGADVVIECSGAGPAATQLLTLARRRGRYLQVGLFGKPVALDFDQVCYRELEVSGSNASTSESWLRALRLLGEGLVDAESVISHSYSLGEWREAFDDFESKRGVKLLLVPGRAKAPAVAPASN